MNITTMRERFMEHIDSYENGAELSDALESIEDYIEQELKKEREEIVEMAEKRKASTNQSFPQPNEKYRNKVIDDIINTIKNRV